MATKRKRHKPIDFVKVGQTLAKLQDVKRRLIEASAHCGDPGFARWILEDARTYVRMIREGLEIGLREGDLQDLTPQNAQQAIYGCRILEDSIQADAERYH
jgi:hypothetical protein